MPPDYEFVKVPSVCVIQMTQALPLTGRKIIYESSKLISARCIADVSWCVPRVLTSKSSIKATPLTPFPRSGGALVDCSLNSQYRKTHFGGILAVDAQTL
jgi:hypothetical protein